MLDFENIVHTLKNKTNMQCSENRNIKPNKAPIKTQSCPSPNDFFRTIIKKDKHKEKNTKAQRLTKWQTNKFRSGHARDFYTLVAANTAKE